MSIIIPDKTEIIEYPRKEVITGSSGYNYAYWKSRIGIGPVINFYPLKTDAKKMLEFYARHFDSVEINCTRYRKLTVSTCENWYKQVSHNDNFKFVIKVDTFITHAKKLVNISEWWENMKECILALKEKFCCLLFQFPPTWKKTSANISKIRNLIDLIKIPKKERIGSQVHCAFEFRDLDWYSNDKTDPLYQDLKKTFLFSRFTIVTLHVPEVRGHDFNFGNLDGGVHCFRPGKKRFVYHRFHGTIKYSSGLYSKEYMNSVMHDIMADKKCKMACLFFNNVDTYTFDVSNPEIDFPDGLPSLEYGYDICNIQLVPTALLNARWVKEFSKG